MGSWLLLLFMPKSKQNLHGLSDMVCVRRKGAAVLNARRRDVAGSAAHAQKFEHFTEQQTKPMQAQEAPPQLHPIEVLWLESRAEAPALPPQIHARKKTINLLNKRHVLEAKLFAWRKNRIKAQTLTFGAVLLIVAIIFQGAGIFASAMKTKGEVLGATTEALANLQEAQQLAGQKNFSEAQHELEYAQQNFETAKSEMSEIGGFFNSLVLATPQGATAEKLVSAGNLIAEAGMALDNFYTMAGEIKVSMQGLESPDGFYQTATGAENYLQSAENDLSGANALLTGIDASVLPLQYAQKFNSYSQELGTAQQALKDITGLVDLFKAFLGPGEKNVLVLFENNNELRPTGGFIGTYGIFKFNDGKIESQTIQNVYNLDDPFVAGSSAKIAPPGPMHNLTDHWGLRDSNWFVDFPQSAEKAAEFYEKEAGETPDAVIAVDPDMFIDILKITGPINFPQYNLVINSDNFRQIFQDHLTSNHEAIYKQMLSDFAPLLLQKIHDLNRSQYAEIFSALLANLREKNILFFDRNPEIETRFQDYGWAGNIINSDNDYLAVFNTNLGGEKTDLSMTQNLQLQSQVQSGGSIINTLTYTRIHGQDLADVATNMDYVRFLVPLGSKLISASGFNREPYYKSDGSGYTWELEQPFVYDPDLKKMDEQTTVERSSGTVVTEEAGHTEFANWMEVDPGTSQTVVLKYELPQNFNALKKYSLIVQKEPGNNPINFSYALSQPKQILWYTPYDIKENGNSVSYQTTINSDFLVGEVFK